MGCGSVVRGGVRLTKNTPKTISRMPILRATGTCSPSQMYPSTGTSAYVIAENGMTKL